MKGNEIESLKIFNEKKIKKLATERNRWLYNGEDIVTDLDYKTNDLAKKMNPVKIIALVKEVIEENDKFKTIVLNNIKELELPNFRAGQKIALTITIDDKEYTRPFNLSSSPNRGLNGEYAITFSNTEEDMVVDYLYNYVQEGDKVLVSNPFGEFYYEPLRDEKNVIAIVSSDGIVPIYSMAQSIAEGTDDYKLTILYSEKNEKNFIFKNKLLEINETSNKVKVLFILSEEKKEGYLSGFASLDKIKKYYDEGNTSFFIAGSEGLLKYLDNELKSLKLPKKFIRYDNFLPRCNIKKVVIYKLSLFIGSEKYELPCYNNKTIMRAIEESGIHIPIMCQNGSCGFCRSELIKGDVKIVNDKRTMAEKNYNFIHPCSTYPKSDIEIIVR